MIVDDSGDSRRKDEEDFCRKFLPFDLPQSIRRNRHTRRCLPRRQPSVCVCSRSVWYRIVFLPCLLVRFCSYGQTKSRRGSIVYSPRWLLSSNVRTFQVPTSKLFSSISACSLRRSFFLFSPTTINYWLTPSINQPFPLTLLSVWRRVRK